jgi:hypothetical protein
MPMTRTGDPVPDPRCHPLVHLDGGEIQAMLRPLSGGSRLWTVARVDGGLVNTTYRATTAADDAGYAVRVYASGHAAFNSERRVLAALSGKLPVPHVVLADRGGGVCAHPLLDLEDSPSTNVPGQARDAGGVTRNITGLQVTESFLVTLYDQAGTSVQQWTWSYNYTLSTAPGGIYATPVVNAHAETAMDAQNPIPPIVVVGPVATDGSTETWTAGWGRLG